MPEANTPPPNLQPCIDAVKKLYDAADAIYDVPDATLSNEKRAEILGLLSEARNLAIECGCVKLVNGADALRITVTGDPTMGQLRTDVDNLKETARDCLKLK